MKIKRCMSLMLCILMLMTILPLNSFFTIRANATSIEDESNSTINVGDCITLGSYNGAPIVWRCVLIDDNGPLMLAEDVLCSKEYDAAGDNSTYHNDGWGYIRKSSGSNCWYDSNIRQWLNSTESKVEYTHCPPSYSSEAGFLSNFSSAELSCIKTVTRLVNVNIWESKRSGYCDGGSTDNIEPVLTSATFDPKHYYYKYIEDSMFLISAVQYNAIYRTNASYLKADGEYYTCITNGNNDACYEWVSFIGANSANLIHNYRASTVRGIRPAFYLNVDAWKQEVKREDGFSFYMNQPTNYLSVETTAKMYVGYYSNGTLDSSARQYLYTVSDSSVINVSASCRWSESHGQIFEITALEEGSATITVTHPDTGETDAIDIYVTPREAGYTFFNLPEQSIEVGNTTHFYNLWGLVVDNFAYTEHTNAEGTVDYYTVTMDVYNKNNLYGAVTAYDDGGGVCSYCIIDKLDSHDSSFVDQCVTLENERCDVVSLIQNPSFYSGESITKHSKVTVYVPAGGYLQISLSSKSSEIVGLFNTFSFLYDTIALTYDLVTMEIDEDLLKDVKKRTIEEVMTDVVEKRLTKQLQKTAWEEYNDFSWVSDDAFASVLELNDIWLLETDIDFEKEIRTRLEATLSIGESIVTKALPTGPIIDCLYTFSDGMNLAVFVSRFIESFNIPAGLYIYAPIDSSKYSSNGIDIEITADSTETIIHAYTVYDSTDAGIRNNTFAQEAFFYSNKYQVYNITMYKNGAETQPDSTVTVSIPIPKNFDASSLKVYRNNDDGTLTDMNAYVRSGYIVFETDHFSYYSLVDETKPIVADDLVFSGASLTLQDDLTINFKVNQALFSEIGYTNPYVIFEFNGVKTAVTEYGVSDGKYIFNFEDIIPHQMNDTIYAVIYAELDGKIYRSETREYSVADYCYNMLSKCSGDEYAEFRTLLVDLLNYGAESQEYMDYNTDALVNADLTEEQKAWGTSEERTLVTVQDTEYKTIENPTVLWKGAGLNLQKSVSMRFKIATDDIDNLTVKVTNDIGQETIISSDSFEATEGGYYVFFDGLNAGQMSDVVYLTVYEGDTAVSHTVRYSIESYAYAKQDGTDTKLSELVKAMMKYGDSAKAYVD